MLYICIPTYNESATIGLLLWRIRKVFQGYSREYEILVYDDASSDHTIETLKPYADVTPLTVLRGGTRRGYGHALERLAREASRRTRYPRRDAMVVMQADFTDQPELLPDLIRRFEGGADIVLGERGGDNCPSGVQRLRQLAPWALRFSVPISGVSDPFATFRLYRISLLRELIKAKGEKPIVTTDGWAANVELLMQTMPIARRVEPITLAPRYDLRVRESRIRPLSDAMAIFRFGRRLRGRSIVAPSSAPAADAPARKQSPPRERLSS